MEQYWRFFTDAWRLFKRYHNPKSDQDWEELINHTSKLHEQYPGEFFKNVLVEIMNEIERLNVDRYKVKK